MSFTLPSGWTFQSSSNNGNQVTYTLPGHTVQAPRLAIFSRVIPTYDQKVGWSVPSYRVRVIHGVVDADGVPVETRTSYDATIRWSMSGNGASEGDEATTEMVAILGATGFAETVFAGQGFPRPASS